MQISDYLATLRTMFSTVLIVIASAVGLVWLNQPSLDQYWALHFHRDSPWHDVSSPLWRQGVTVMKAAQAAQSAFLDAFSDKPPAQPVTVTPVCMAPAQAHPASAPLLPHAVSEPASELQLSRWLSNSRAVAINQLVRLSAATKEERADVTDQRQRNVVLTPGKKVLLIGDSMMEGVAPRLAEMLRDRLAIRTINLSKRSTGLAYPGFFNWPLTTQNALAADPDIGMLVVFLGPNDPWDMPVVKGKPYAKFKSPVWEEEYRRRIRQILALGKQFSVPVVWLLPPNMARSRLNQSMHWLDTLYHSEVSQAGGTVIDVNTLFDYQGDSYQPTINIDGKPVRIRANDGIHFTPAGEKLIAAAVVAQIHPDGATGEDAHE